MNDPGSVSISTQKHDDERREEVFMDTSSIVIVVSVFLIIAAVFAIRACLRNERLCKQRQQKEEDESLRLREEADRRDDLRSKINEIFGIELEKIHEGSSQDEIVRFVNLLAFSVAKSCVDQDKGIRGGRIKESDLDYLNNNVRPRKAAWAKARNLAIQAIPELKDRLPHFSEVEPLKSYNTEHLLQKRAVA
jgi:hypothetical protein